MIKVTSEIIISSITTLKIHLWVTFWWSSLKWQRSHSRTDYGLSLKRGRVSFTPSQVPLLASIPWRIFSYKHRLPIHFFKLNHIVITIRLDQINFGLSYVRVAWLSSSVPPDFFSSPRTDFEAEWILLSFFIAAVVIKSPWAYDQKIAKTLKHAKEATSAMAKV